MSVLTALRSHQVLADLKENRAPHVGRLSSGERQMQLVTVLLAAFDGLSAPGEAAASSIPALSRQHMELMAAFGTMVDVHRLNPLAESADREAATRLHEAVVAGRLGRGHEPLARVEYMLEVKAIRPSLEQDLHRLTTLPGQPSLSVVLDRLFAVGAEIQEETSAQSYDEPAQAVTRRALVLEAAQVLSNLRATIRVELKTYPELPENLEFLILGFADLQMKRSRRRPVRPAVIVDQPELVDVSDAPMAVAPEDCDEACGPVEPQPAPIPEVAVN